MKRIFTHLFVAVLLMLSTTSWAQFENGKVYRIVCSGTTSVSLGASALTDVAAVSTSETDKSQQWYVTVNGSNYTFRNLSNGRYLQGNNTTSGGWSLTETSNNFTVSTVSNNYCIRQTGHSNGYAYMHKDAGNNIVSWENSAGNSQWTPKEVAYTPEQLQTIWEEVESLVVPSTTVDAYEGYLDVLFSDKSCVTPKLATLDAAKATDAYKNLPAALQKMVDKVYGGNWTESTVAPADRPNGNNNTNHSLWTVSDTWDNDYAKRFRVQMYEPYSIEGEITSYLRFNAHCNMDNPTGIYADGGEPIYIMVEGTIEEGAELWIAHQTGHGATGYYSNATYTRLHEGLNVVPYFNDGSQLWINYLVHTYDGNGATIAEKFPHKLSDYKPLKIHIEGGRINGYYNAIGDFRATDSGTENLWGEVDNDEDWNYYKARVALSTDFALLGHRQTPLFPFGTYESGKNAFCTYNEGGGLEYALAYHLDNITVPTTPNCYGGSGNTFGTFDGSYSGMNLSASNGKINIMLEAWDRIMYSELATMGLVSTSTMDKMNSLYPRWTSNNQPAEIYNYGSATVNGETKTYKEFCQGLDYSEYFNHHGAGVGAPSGYMSGGWRVCNYHYNTMGSIIGVIAAEAGPTWGPAHEIGHQHQGVFNLNGQTEVTNNFFSNVAVWYMGMGTSRVNGSEGSLASVLGAFNTDGNDLYTNNIWAITHLYYRLWLYYHLAGNNTQFWPRLFELCRQVPLVNGGQISGETSLLRFYQHACDAAGEDLTEFFRAHGFFEIMDNRLVGDYSNATYNVTQEQIDAAIKSVKDKGYPVNYAALLINDATSETTVKHDGATKRSLWDNNPTAEFGSVNDFIDGDVEVLTNYAATVNADGSVTMSGGEGGIGFLVLNEDGELVSFSNKTEFKLKDEAAYLLATGKATIVAVDTDSETAEAEVDLSAIQREMLEALIEKIEAMPIDDGTYTHIGFYTKACAADLLAVLESAKTVLASGTGFAAAYELLYTTKEKFVNSPNLSYVPFDPSLTYIITNYAYKDKIMYLNSGARSNTGIDKTLDTSKWQFKTTGTDGVYNLYNVSGNYLAAASKSTLVASVSDQASAATYSLIQDSPVGTWAISVSPAAEFATLHDNSYGNVVGWEAGANASKWYLTAVEGSTNSQATQASDELQALIAKAETLMNEVATVSLKGKVQLQADNANSAFYITSNATEAGHEPKYLLDNNVSTYFHTVWWGTSPGADHYLQIDLGEEYPVDQFVFKYTNLPTSSWNVDAAEAITVQVANTLDNFTTIATLKTSDSNPLPTAKEGTYTSATMGTKDNNYRYIRLIVTDATGGMLDNHYYFGMSEFSLERLNSCSKVKDAYTDHITQDVVATVADKLVDAKTVIANGGDIAAAKTALQSAYETLVEEYNGVSDAKKEELQELINETKTLLNTVGSITTAETEELALQVTNASDAYYLSTNSQENAANRNISKLVDGVTDNSDSYFHTNWKSSVGADHHLLLDMGDGNSLGEFTFKYTTRNNNAGIDAPRTIVVEGSNDNSGFTQIVELTGLPTGQHQTYESAVLGNKATGYRYIRFRVTNGAGTVSGYYYFAMSEFDVTAVGSTTVTINDEYKTKVTEELFATTNSKVVDAETLMKYTTSTELLDAQIAALTAAKAALEEAMTKVTIDKTALQSLYEDALALYDKMANDDGTVNADYTPSALTADMLTAAKTALDAAKDALDSSNSQSEIDAAEDALDEQYNALLGIEDANVATTIDKSGLSTAIANANALIAAIEAKGDGYYESVAGFGLAELSTALQNAQDVVGRFYLTEKQYNETLTQLNTCYTTTNGIVALDCNSENRNNLSTLIGNVNALLTVIADAGETTVALPLQSTKADAAFYIWCNDPASDSQGVAGLIDKNADGTANTGTFLGTNWNSDVPAYTHYIEIDLGVAGTIDQLTMDYTTRNSTHADQRPNTIKILGSNDKANYNEITEITSGLAANANEKWSMGELLDLGGRYRYIRVAVGSQRGFFHMADFNLYTKLSHTLKEHYTTAEGLDLTTLCLALDEAQDAAARYMTAGQCTAVYNKLEGCYTTANAIASNDYSGRDELATLKTAADALVDGVVAIDETETVLALQATDATAPYYIYCNAPGATNNYAGDNLGVAALLDADEGGEPITATFLHTSYVAGSHDDALDHYLRVDMGESNLLSFKFRYTPRIGNTGNAPLVMLIEGSNDCVNFEEITTLTGMETTYQSSEITNGKAYRYIRFMVKDTHNHSNFEGHKFFAMSHFEMTACKTVTISQEYASPNLSVDVAANAYNELVDANALDTEHYLPSEVGVAAKAELQAAYDALNAAIALQNIPVKLTTDVNNPVLYKIKVKSNEKVFTYDGQSGDASKNPVLSVDALGNKYQAWYFMQGNNEDSNDDILILPYYHEGALNTTHKLGYPNINGSTRPVVSEDGASSYNWYITFTKDKTTEGWWNLQPQDGTSDNTFVNQQGGSSSTILSFWKSANNPGDNGSQFQFVLDETDYSLSDAYYALLAQYEASVAEVAYGTKIGTYSEVSVTAYNEAYNNAAALLEAKNSTDAEYDEARATLLEKYNAIEYNRGLCRIRSAYTGGDGYSTGKLIYVGAENKLYFEEAEDEDLSKYVWEFVPVKGGYNIKSLHTQSNVVSATTWGGQVALSDEGDPKLVTIDFLAEDIVRLNVSGGHPLHAQQQGSTIVHYAGDLESASAWYLEEISAAEAKENIKHTVSLGANESGSDTKAYSTLYLAYNAKIPEGVTASIVTRINEIGQLEMTPVEGGILPANTAVVLSRETAGDVDFLYTDEGLTFDPTGNMLRGASCNELINCGDEHNVYMLGKKSGRVAFYWAYENRNENGVKYEVDGSPNHNEGGYVLCKANKAYLLERENSDQAAAAMYGFLFGGTAGVDSVNAEAVEDTVYDLQGRKLVKVASPGIYIVNGKKVYVTEIED